MAWTSGTLSTADGSDYSISASNTGNMAARTWIYFDPNTSTTAYQTSTTNTDAIGEDKILVAVAENTSTEAFFQVFNGTGGLLLTANEIAANSLTANEIAANTITATELNVSELSAISADMGNITAGNIVLSEFIRSGQSDYDTGTGFWLGDDAGTAKFSIGDSTGDKLTWDGSTLAISGSVDLTNAVKTFTPTWSGFSSDPADDISYLDFGSHFILFNDTGSNNTGTSNSTSFSLSGLPVAIQPGQTREAVAVGITTGNVRAAMNCTISVAGAITFEIYDGTAPFPYNNTGWTASGTKGLSVGFMIVYPN